MQETWVWPPGQKRFPGGGNGNPLQYSCLGDPMDRKYGVARVRHDFAIKPTYLGGLYHPQSKILSITPTSLTFTRYRIYCHCLLSLFLKPKEIYSTRSPNCFFLIIILTWVSSNHHQMANQQKSTAPFCALSQAPRNNKDTQWWTGRKWLTLVKLLFVQSVSRVWLCIPMDHTRLPCPSPSPGVCSNPCPLSLKPNHLILCRPLLLLPSIFPSIRVMKFTDRITWKA